MASRTRCPWHWGLAEKGAAWLCGGPVSGRWSQTGHWLIRKLGLDLLLCKNGESDGWCKREQSPFLGQCQCPLALEVAAGAAWLCVWLCWNRTDRLCTPPRAGPSPLRQQRQRYSPTALLQLPMVCAAPAANPTDV